MSVNLVIFSKSSAICPDKYYPKETTNTNSYWPIKIGFFRKSRRGSCLS